MEDYVSKICDNYEKVNEKIASAALKCGRKTEDVKLVVVTKAQPTEVLEAVIVAGAKIIGENYPEETVEKKQALSNPERVSWHMIGHLQSRKAKYIIEHFDVLESLDSFSLAEKLDRLCAEANRILPVMLEFNVGGEESKSGWDASNKENWESITNMVSNLCLLKHIKICGLMTMPPLLADEMKTRANFRMLKDLQELLISHFPNEDFSELSMGTSSDYEIAIAEGATLIRIGQAIVGPRPYKSK